MTYRIRELADLAKVSVRTLQYYDEVGLLKPAYTGENGYRYYEDEQLLLLQQILFFKELGMELKLIQKIMTHSRFDKLAALMTHKEQMLKDIARKKKLIMTIERTIKHLKGEMKMTGFEMLNGFNADQQAGYEQYLIDRWGEDARTKIEESHRRTASWSKQDFENVKREKEAINKKLIALLDREPSSEEVQKVIAEHCAWIERFYKTDRDAYSALGEVYTDHPDFRKKLDKEHPALAEFLSAAMKIYAERNL